MKRTTHTSKPYQIMTLRIASLVVAVAAALFIAQVAAAAPVLVAVDAPPGFAPARAYQSLVLQALADHGISTADPELLRQPVPLATAAEVARDMHADKLLALHVAPLSEGALLSLEEVGLDDLWTSKRASLLLSDESEAHRVASRLVRSVVLDEPLDEGKSISTITKSEGLQPEHLPGEFLWGLGVQVGVAPGADLNDRGMYGFQTMFGYETSNALIGTQANLSFLGDNDMVEWSAFGAWIPIDGNISPYIGAGIGVSWMDLQHRNDEGGGHALVMAGVEFMRFHAARLFIGADVILPFYQLDRYSYDSESGDSISGGSEFLPITRFSVSLAF